MIRCLATAVTVTMLAAMSGCRAATPAPIIDAASDQWPAYAGPAGGRYSPLDQISAQNVARLEVAWTYRTGETGGDARDGHELTFEATPLHFDDRLYVPTAYGRVIALDPPTGGELWSFDAGVDRAVRYSEVTSRGVSAWRDPSVEPGAPCAARVFAGTIDAYLIALDAATGRPCASFGRDGRIDLAALAGVERERDDRDYQVTSPPAVVGDLVVTGASIGDNWSVDTGSGAVRAFDARTGALTWSWHPLGDPRGRTGAANAWSVLNVDEARDLVFVPTSSPSPDFYGGLRPGDNRHANALVALRGSTGEVVWSFQTVHHDLWDYDLAAQPVLVDVVRDGGTIAAIAQPTKMGWLFVLDRETGVPLFEVEERPVPASAIEGEVAWSTQPAPVKPRALMPHGPLTPDTVWGPTPEALSECQAIVAPLRSEGIYTPPSLQGTIMAPGNGAGTNWGSAAFAPGSRRLVLNTARVDTIVQLLRPAEFERMRKDGSDGWEFGVQRGAPYGMRRRTLETAQGIPCSPPPWGTLAAVDLDSGDVAWEVPLGHLPDGHPFMSLAGDPPIGLPTSGGPIITAGGLVFIAATRDQRLRAFDLASGRELWQAKLPFAGIATPMTYLAADGRQYVVIAAGGHGKAGLERGDAVVAFALPR